MEYVTKIAKIDQNERRSAVLDILRREGLPFTHYFQKHNEDWVENIVVSINPSPSRLVIGAHYDSVEGSSGANDNASGVSVLLKLAKALYEKQEISADIVFFDREEYPNSGSEKYISFLGKENIGAMINLDICGNGNRIVVWAKGNEENVHFQKMFSPEILTAHNVTLIGYLPNGDDAFFERAGISNISIAVLPEDDVSVFNDFYENYIKKGIKPTEAERKNGFASLKVLPTIHNGAKDNIDSVSQASMDLLLSYLCDGLIEK